MNYFAHGWGWIDQPFVLAGTAIPDWLSVADRKTRLRRQDVLPFANADGSPEAQIAAGILRHLHDDEWFHATAGFHQVTEQMAQLFREHLEPSSQRWRPTFLGHIATELLLDGVLIQREPARLTAYYQALAAVDPALIEAVVRQIAGGRGALLSRFVGEFLAARFLFDYLTASGLLRRLNQVLSRIKLGPLPESTASVISAGRLLVERQLEDLLPATHFPPLSLTKDNAP